MSSTLTNAAAQELRDNLVPEEAINALRLGLPILEQVCERAGRDFDEDEGDDANLFGQQCSRRGRNLIAKHIETERPSGLVVLRPRNSMVVFAAGTRVHFWAAGDDEGSPRLRGGKTKPEILDACVRQLTLWREERTEAPHHLVVAYRATPASRRLEKVVVGLPRDADTWEFAVELYTHTAKSAGDSVRPARAPRYDEADAIPAPVIELRPRSGHNQRGQ